MSNGRSLAIWGRGRTKSLGGFLISLLVGLLLAYLFISFKTAGVLLAAAGVVVTITVFVRRVDLLIYAWFVLTAVIQFIMLRFLPLHLYGTIGRSIFWGFLGCAIIAWGIDGVLSKRRFVAFDDVPLKAVVFIFVVWAGVTSFTSMDVFNSLKKFSHIVIALAVSYVLYDVFCRNQGNMKKLLGVVWFLVVTISVLTIVAAGHGLVTGVPIYKKVSLWFWNPNSLGALLLVTSPILISSGRMFMANRNLRFLLGSVMILALFFSFSRAAWLATAAAFAFMLWSDRTKMPVSVMIIIGAFLLALVTPVVGEDIFDFLLGYDYSGRKEIWKAAWKAASEYPVLGTGLGNSIMVLPDYIVTPWLKAQDTHNLYLKNAVEMGFASVVMWAVFAVVFFYSSGKIEASLRSKHLRLLTRGARATFFGLCIHGFFENGFVLTAFDAAEFTVMLPYILLIMPFAAKKLEEKEEEAVHCAENAGALQKSDINGDLG